METTVDQQNLRCLFTEMIPEARQEFLALSEEASSHTLLNKLYEVTAVLAHQNKFNAVKRCLQVADALLRDGDKKVSTAVCTVYIYRLALLLDQRNSCANVIYFLLPRALRAEYQRQLYACQA